MASSFIMIKTCLVFFAFCYIKLAHSTGKLEIKLESFENPTNQLANGDCCVAETSECRISCSNQFKICISRVSSSGGGTCDIGQTHLTHLFNDDEVFNSGNTETRFKNPLIYNFTEWKNDVEVKITVLNHPEFNIVAEFKGIINKAAHNVSSWTKKTLTYITSRSDPVKKIVFNSRTTCDVGFLGDNCSVHACIPRDDNQGHYTCNTTQEKVCLPGWGGRNCIEKLCTPKDSNTEGHYTCNATNQEKVCLPGWGGRNCSVKLCTPKDSNTEGHYTCNTTTQEKLCLAGWGGRNCTVKLCTPKNNDEEGHYTCNATTQEKVCMTGWRGRNCTVKLCTPKNNYEGHFTCNAEHEIVCLEGWYDPRTNCTVKKCIQQNDNINGHFRCDSNNKKICLPGWLNITTNCTVPECVPLDNENGHYGCDEKNNRICLKGWRDPSTNCTTANKTTVIKISANNTTIITTTTTTTTTSPILSQVTSTNYIYVSMSSALTMESISKSQFISNNITPSMKTIKISTDSISTSVLENMSMVTPSFSTKFVLKPTATATRTLSTSVTKTVTSKTIEILHTTNIAPSFSESNTPKIHNTATTPQNEKYPTTSFKATAQPSMDLGNSNKNNKDETIVIIACVAFIVLVAWAVALMVVKHRYDQRRKVRPAIAEHATDSIINTTSTIDAMKETKLISVVV